MLSFDGLDYLRFASITPNFLTGAGGDRRARFVLAEVPAVSG